MLDALAVTTLHISGLGDLRLSYVEARLL